MDRRLKLTFLAGSALVLGTWAWAQQGGPAQGPMGPGGMMGGPGGWGMMGGPAYVPLNRRFTSNGERIYYTGISAKTGPIVRSGGPMWVYHTGVGCVACHGVHGRGGVPIMMGTAIPADIRYDVLTGKVQEPGFSEAAPGSGAIMWQPVSVCHQVSTMGQRSLPTTV